MAAAVLFPPEIFVDHLLVAVRDAALRLPGSNVPYHRHARQAAAIAAADPNASDELVAAALLSGIGEVILTSFARHPAATADTTATSEQPRGRGGPVASEPALPRRRHRAHRRVAPGPPVSA